MKNIQDMRIRFVGAGNMAASLIGGLINKGLTSSQMTASDPQKNQRDYIEQQFQVQTFDDNNAHFGMPDVVVVAVKPQIMKVVLNDVAANLKAVNPLVISVAAGITTEQIVNWTHTNHGVIRTMPNTPALIGQGAIGMYANNQVTQAQKYQTEQIMDAVGTSIWVDQEQQIDAVTALSGSGPAYFFMFMECLQEAAESIGLSSEQAALLTKKTAVGASLLAERSPESLMRLKDRVTSPNGTTYAALQTFEQNNMKEIVDRAVHAAFTRSIELSRVHD